MLLGIIAIAIALFLYFIIDAVKKWHNFELLLVVFTVIEIFLVFLMYWRITCL